MNLSEQDLRDLLHRVDDVAVEVPELVAPAKARVRRRRWATGAAAAVGALAVAGSATALWPSPSPDHVMVAGTPSSSTASTPAKTPSPVLTKAEVERRCAPQLKAYDQLRTYGPGAQWTLLHPFEYRAGDIAAFGSPGRNPAFCLVPEAGSENDPVDLATFVPDARQQARLVELCSEGATRPRSEPFGERETPAPDGRTTDLRGATVRSVVQPSGGPAQAILEHDGTLYSCLAMAPQWDLGATTVRPLPAEPSATVDLDVTGAGPGNKSTTGGTSSAYYWGTGRLPKQASTIELTVSGHPKTTVDVGDDGVWNLMVRVPGRPTGYTWRVLDASGAPISAGSGVTPRR